MTRLSADRSSRRSFVRRLGLLASLTAAAPILAACDSGMSAPAKPTEPAKAAAPAPTQPPAAAPKPTEPPAPAAKPTAEPAAPAKPAAAGPAGQPATGVVKWFVRSNPLENKWQDEYAVPEYKKRNARIEIQKIVVPGAEFNAKLFALQASGDTPNIFGFAAFATYWARGLIIPIDDFLQGEKGLAEQHFPGMFDTYRWWGKRWGMPMAPRFGTPTAYNMDLFDKAGVPYPKMDFSLKEWNANVMLDMATKLTRNYGKPDVVFGINFGPWSPHGLAYLWGGDTYTKAIYDNGIDDKTTVDSPESKEAHQFKLDLIQKHKVNPAAGDTQTISVLGNPFMTGRVAMNVEGGWIWSTFSAIKDFRWGPGTARDRLLRRPALLRPGRRHHRVEGLNTG
jgi:multiple sugar transport system substrate-binding protein